ncbi:nucleotidyltransferase [Pedobacter sp. G11]|uniref:nucleotidyltransferase domain-containing protein n=1 Tax=Pedobacter sp. G11 TaxID=2482728 RepID=UPI000F5E6793|nr:nucleotidyltransferase [Pedobacter sp. G11]AZI26465.1 nucleotidyltransferase [Pedobacter sp. G11]
MIKLSFEEKKYFGNILEQLARSIDLTDAQYEEAISKYDAVGGFLSGSYCSLAGYNPKIVPQGSMRIGTVTRPVQDECEFDMDANCRLDIATPVSQYRLKQLIGDCFKSSKTYERMLLEKRRCWRLKYAAVSRFHFDIVPAIADDFNWLLMLGVPLKYAQHAVLITDTEHPSYHYSSSDLPRSNPEGYALWFLDVMKIQADAIRLRLAAELKMSVQEVPDFKVRTPLQQAVQLMKRHRDLMYGDNDLKPISIIITTLAAMSYQQVMTEHHGGLFYDILIDIVERMASYIKIVNGRAWIANPVNPNENFADKWHGDARLAHEFNRWHRAMLSVLTTEKVKSDQEDLQEEIKLSFGTRSVNEVFSAEKNRLSVLRAAAGLVSSSAAFTTSSGSITPVTGAVKNAAHSFHFGTGIHIPRSGSYKYAYLTHQKKLIESHFDFLKCSVENRVLKCTGYVKPDGCNQAYKVLIEHVVGKEPKTTILEPSIAPSAKIHMYADRSLCLSYPKDTKWTEKTKIYENTIPWLIEWILFYELYLVNGNIWEGPESPEHLTPASMNYNEDNH